MVYLSQKPSTENGKISVSVLILACIRGDWPYISEVSYDIVYVCVSKCVWACAPHGNLGLFRWAGGAHAAHWRVLRPHYRRGVRRARAR